jgi:phosphatidylserine/phosphatidylglycerophosphate/cardiolipin synthase-like enzyme
VAVQIDPEEGRIQEPERARRYLESYFQDADISIYWGSVEDFARELQQRWESEGR